MHMSGNPRWQSLLAVLVFGLLLASLAAAVTAPSVSPSRAPGTEVARQRWHATDPVYTIRLPFEEMPSVPLGPHHAQFTASCRLCHSPRLVLTQPLLTESQWKAVVHKMVAVYGAPLTPAEEASVVEYLMAVRGRAP
jgi:hypothetical protein